MSASNDELLLYNAARDGKLEVVKELLSKGVGTGYRNEVSYLIIYCYPSYIYYYRKFCCCCWWWCPCVLLAFSYIIENNLYVHCIYFWCIFYVYCTQMTIIILSIMMMMTYNDNVFVWSWHSLNFIIFICNIYLICLLIFLLSLCKW